MSLCIVLGDLLNFRLKFDRKSVCSTGWSKSITDCDYLHIKRSKIMTFSSFLFRLAPDSESWHEKIIFNQNLNVLRHLACVCGSRIVINRFCVEFHSIQLMRFPCLSHGFPGFLRPGTCWEPNNSEIDPRNSIFSPPNSRNSMKIITMSISEDPILCKWRLFPGNNILMDQKHWKNHVRLRRTWFFQCFKIYPIHVRPE